MNSKREIEKRQQLIRDISKRKVGSKYQLTEQEKELLEQNKQIGREAQKNKEEILKQMSYLHLNIQRLENQISTLKGENINNSPTSSKSSQSKEKKYRTCTSCNGTGLVPNMRHDRTIEMVGDGYTYHLCNQCGKRHHGTSHKTCTSCRGTGKREIR